MDILSKNDEQVLVTILKLGENAYGVTIRRQIQEITGKVYGYGTLYSALNQLVRRRLVVKITGDPKPEKGGRRKYFYRLTKLGAQALKQAHAAHSLLWNGITEAGLDMIQ